MPQEFLSSSNRDDADKPEMTVPVARASVAPPMTQGTQPGRLLRADSVGVAGVELAGRLRSTTVEGGLALGLEGTGTKAGGTCTAGLGLGRAAGAAPPEVSGVGVGVIVTVGAETVRGALGGGALARGGGATAGGTTMGAIAGARVDAGGLSPEGSALSVFSTLRALTLGAVAPGVFSCCSSSRTSFSALGR
jgi:hypothetical protein